MKDKGIPKDPKFAPDQAWAIFKPVLVRKKLWKNQLVALRQRVRDGRRQDLGHVHLLEHLDGEVLEAADVDGALLAGLKVAASNAEVRGRAYLD